ncbi:MAG: DUF402 domain-containing protein [Acidilobaceae archaeon]
MELARVRVRGIYATALSVILLERGFLIADASDVLKSRLSRPIAEGPANVTVKNLDEDRDSLLIVGAPWEAGVKVEEAILEYVGYASRARGRLGVGTVVDAVSLGGCRAEGPGGVEITLDAPCPEPGKTVRCYIVRDALRRGEAPRARAGVAAIGLYVSVYAPGSGVSFSEHLRDRERISQLESLAGRVADRGVHVRFRSNSRLGGLAEIAEELESLVAEAERMLSEPASSEPRVVKRGEYVSLIGLTSAAKQRLDEARGKVCPTILMHHSLKSGGDAESASVDVLEEALRMGLADRRAGLALVSRILSSLSGRRITVEHKRPDGEVISLGPFTLESYEVEEDRVELTLSRVFTKPGVLDGLGVEKKPGDYSITRLSLSEWHVIHEYYRADGRLLGVYANVNSPPEVSSRGIRYLDLYVDVVAKPGEEPRVLDSEALERAREEGLVSEALYERALEEAKSLTRRLKSYPPAR